MERMITMCNSNPHHVSNRSAGFLSGLGLIAISFALLFGPNVQADPLGSAGNTVTLSWTATGGDSLIGTATSYDLRYSLDSALLVNNFEGASVVSGMPAPRPSGSAESFTVTNLASSTVYYFAIKAEDGAGNRSGISNVVKRVSLALDLGDDGSKPSDFSLAQNYPNPFNPTTTIEYFLPSASNVRLTVYNISGQVVTTLIKGRRSSGNHSHDWDGYGSNGSRAASGVYFYRLQTDQFTETRKMILLK